MYTYTTRNDTGTNECFVGLIVNDEEIYIKEAGEHCLRDIDPRTVGMRLYKKGSPQLFQFYLFLPVKTRFFLNFWLDYSKGTVNIWLLGSLKLSYHFDMF